MPYVRLKHNERNGGISASLIGLCDDGGEGLGAYPLEKSCSLRFVSMTSMIQYELVSLGFNEGKWHVVQEYINCAQVEEENMRYV